ncbi:DNA recombination protein RmuC [Rhizobium sp. PAMB 3182]
MPHLPSLAELANMPAFPAAAVAAFVIMLLVLLVLLRLRGKAVREQQAARTQMMELLRSQTEMQGRLAAMADVFGARQQELNHAIGHRLDGMAHRLGSSIHEQTRATGDNLRKLQERLAVIDAAQNNIQTLAKDVVGLQAILSNKQTRGAFGQARMEAIIADGLPMGGYHFQATLSNGSRPDCTVTMPNGAPSLVIDAKFPLEGWNAMRDAATADDRKSRALQFRRDLETHIRDIAEKYLIAGETQEMAFLFVPSESIFASIHEEFEAVVQKAQRSRVIIVSPSLLMLSIQVIQAMLKDQRMREQAHLIQGEVAILMDDLGRLDDRVRKLQAHFNMAEKDVEQILTSTAKLTRRGDKIAALELQQAPLAPAPSATAARPDRTVESRTGHLTLRLVDEE